MFLRLFFTADFFSNLLNILLLRIKSDENMCFLFNYFFLFINHDLLQIGDLLKEQNRNRILSHREVVTLQQNAGYFLF